MPTPTTIKLALHSRHTLSGASPSSGADATAERARIAYEEMAAATWERDDAPASFPVHEYDRSRPTGDAYKAVFGYDAAARTQRACCGAVCYTFLIPDDAVNQVTSGPCTLDAVSARIVGDRYLDAGAVLSCHVSASPEPPSWADVLASALASGPVCATSGQTAETRNDRHGVTELVTLAPETPAAPLRYLHLVLRLHDYLGVVGAWIDGGAMLSESAASATFSRPVAPDYDTVGEGCPLDVGVFSASQDLANALKTAPAVSVRATYVFSFGGLSFDNLADTSLESRVRNLLAIARGLPGLYASAPASTEGRERIGSESFGTGDVTIALRADRIMAAAMSFSGWTGNRTFRRMYFSNSVVCDVPFRLVVFGIPRPICIDNGTTHWGSPLVSWRTILDKTFLAGEATSIGALSAIPGDGGLAAEGDAVDVPGVTLAAVDSPSGSLDVVNFARPFHSGWYSTVVIALVPNAMPTNPSTDGTMAVDCYINAEKIRLRGCPLNIDSAWNGSEFDYTFRYTGGETVEMTGWWIDADINFYTQIDNRWYVKYQSFQSYNISVTAAISGNKKTATLDFTLAEKSAWVTLSNGQRVLVTINQRRFENTYTLSANDVGRNLNHGGTVYFHNAGDTEQGDELQNPVFTIATTIAGTYATATINPGYPILE